MKATATSKEVRIFDLHKLNIYQFSLFLSICTFFTSVLVAIVYRNIEAYLEVEPIFYMSDKLENSMSGLSLEFMNSVIVAPLLETLVFQFILIILLKKVLKKNFTIILISALIFSVGHLSNSTLNMISTFFTGLYLAFSYLFWFDKTGIKKKGFEASLAVHAVHNLYYILLSFVPASVLF